MIIGPKMKLEQSHTRNARSVKSEEKHSMDLFHTKSEDAEHILKSSILSVKAASAEFFNIIWQ